MLRNLAVTVPWARGAFSKPLPLASGTKFETSKNADTAVNAINAVILVRRMMETSCWVVYSGVGEKTLTKKFSANEIMQSISMANLFLSCAHSARQS
jgi:hypothetical protein